MIIQLKRYWILSICFKSLFYFIINWSVYPQFLVQKVEHQPELGHLGDKHYAATDQDHQICKEDSWQLNISAAEHQAKCTKQKTKLNWMTGIFLWNTEEYTC